MNDCSNQQKKDDFTLDETGLHLLKIAKNITLFAAQCKELEFNNKLAGKVFLANSASISGYACYLDELGKLMIGFTEEKRSIN